MTSLPDFQTHGRTLEHDAETWEALTGRNAGMKRPTIAGLLWMLAAAAPASAQTFPSKTITIISPAPAGGVTDIIGRGLAQRFAKSWGQQAVVENKPGANNQLAAEHIVNSPPDGHTLFIAP